MKTQFRFTPRTSHLALGLLLLTTFNSQLSTQAQGTAFTYQGRLNDGANPANGIYEILFRPFGAFTGGSQLTFPRIIPVAVSNGLFTTTMDFGPTIFEGSPVYLQLEVRTNGPGADYNILTPRQPFTATPYAIFAANAANVVNGALQPEDLNLGSFGTTFWKVGGNAGTSTDFIGTTDNQPFDVRVNNVRVMRYRLTTDPEGFYTDSPNVIGGSPANSVSTTVVGATIGGGGGVFVETEQANRVTADFGTVSGGLLNHAGGSYSTVSGGIGNAVSDSYSTVSGGSDNAASGSYSTVSGGSGNTASGYLSTVPGGAGNTASGYGSFAAGRFARATHFSSFVWGDGNTTSSTSDGSVTMRASGGFRFFTSSGAVGARLDANETSWSTISDRNAKKNFQPVDAVAVLNKLSSIPLTRWNYKWESETNTPHLGPMAQDFKAAFYPGRDDKSISTLEFDGVALVAIQGLNQKVEEQLRVKDARIDVLEKELGALKELVAKFLTTRN